MLEWSLQPFRRSTSSTGGPSACFAATTTGWRSTRAIRSLSCGERPPTPRRSSMWSRSGRPGRRRPLELRARWSRRPARSRSARGGSVAGGRAALIDAGVARVVGTAAFDRRRRGVRLRPRRGGNRRRRRDRPDERVAESTELTTARARRCAEAGVATVICTAIDATARGRPDLELLREVRARFEGRCSRRVGFATRPTSLRAWPRSRRRGRRPRLAAPAARPVAASGHYRRGLAHLRQAELVAGGIAERGVDAVGSLLRRLGELEPSRRELLVRGRASSS